MSLREFFFLPIVASSHGQEIDFVIYLVHFLMLALLVGWGGFFIFSVIRFSKWFHPKANYHGVKSHASTYIEIVVALIEVALLVGFSIPFWSKQVNAFPSDRPDAVELRVVAEQFAWNIHYPGADGLFGNTDPKFFNKQSNPLGIDPDDPNGKDDITTINQLHLPIGRPAIIRLSSKDVIHSFAIPVMRVKQDAIPGLSIPVWFTPTKSGEFDIACAQLCGIGHYYMKGKLVIHHAEEYQAWLDANAPSDDEDEGEYDDFWN
ncbi:MAG: hypothetical protein KC713_04210 [Candidatus Omnitrophica bacterium]|nr:hypothetical protein [Candidatus Omnitrophota bacterium]